MIAKLGISMERKMATGVFRNINSSNSGAISPDEFKYFILSWKEEEEDEEEQMKKRQKLWIEKFNQINLGQNI